MIGESGTVWFHTDAIQLPASLRGFQCGWKMTKKKKEKKKNQMAQAGSKLIFWEQGFW